MHYASSLEYNFCVFPAPKKEIYFIMFTFNNLPGKWLGQGQRGGGRGVSCSTQFWVELNSAREREILFSLFILFIAESLFAFFTALFVGANWKHNWNNKFDAPPISHSLPLTLHVGHRRVKSCHFRLFQSAEEISSPYFSNTFTKPKRKKINLILLIFFFGFFSSFKLQKLRVVWREVGRGSSTTSAESWLALCHVLAWLGWSCPALTGLLLGAGQHGQTSQVIY